MQSELRQRSTQEVLDDHLRCRKSADIEADIERNYSPKVVVHTSRGAFEGHDAVRRLNSKLREHVPEDIEIVLNLTTRRFAYIEWRAREPGRSVEDGADSFVIEDGRIVFQSIHYSVHETMPM